jgi:predicted kinase
MVGEVILIAGLPGSGKTVYMEPLRQAGWNIFDDFKANAYNDSSIFFHSQNYEPLLKALREGQKCVVADIDFCKTDSRNEAELVLRRQLPDVKLSWLFFANDIHACQANIKRRASRSIDDNLRALSNYCVQYHIPTCAHVIPVWQPSE